MYIALAKGDELLKYANNIATTITNHNQPTPSKLARLTNLSLSVVFIFSLLASSLTILLTNQTAKADTGITQIGQIGGYDTPMMENPSGLALDSSGNIYVADSSNNRIQKLAPDGSFIAKWGANNGDGTLGSGNAEFNAPYGLALDTAGNVFVADSGNHRIQKLAPDGTFIAKWGANNGDGTQGSGNAEFNSPSGLVLDTAGNIYVADSYNHRIQKLASDGSYIAKWGANNGDGTQGSGNAEFNSPSGLALDSSGNIYVADSGNNRIQKLTPDGSFIAKWGANNGDGTQGSGNAEFRYPSGLALDSSGNIYVADSSNNRIQKLAPDGSFIAKWGANNGDGTQGFGNAEFRYPNGLALDSSGNIYVADTDNNRIQKLAPNGSYLTQYPTGYSIFSYGLAVDANYNVYSPQFMYSSYKPNNTLKLSSTGQLTSYWPNEDGFTPASSVASSDALYTVLADGNISTAKLVKTSLDGTPIAEWALPSVSFSLSLDSAGNLYYFDLTNSKVIKYSSTGTVLAEYGTAGSGDGQIGAGCDGDGNIVSCRIALDSAGNIYVTDVIETDDSAHTRLQKFSPSFDFLGKWEATDGNTTVGFAVSPSGKVYLHFINESGSRLQKLTSNLSPLSQYTPTGEQAYFSYANPVATANGRIYISDFMKQRINILCDNDESSNGCALPADDNSGGQASNVATIPTPTNPDGTTTTPVTITTPTGTTITCSSGLNEATQSIKDASFNYPLGLVQFCFDTPNQNNAVNLTYITNLKPQDVVARKYNPNNNSYFNIENATITQTIIDNQPALSLTYTITDNGDLDLDPTLGKITDPVGLATLTTASPNTGLGKHWLLGLK